MSLSSDIDRALAFVSRVRPARDGKRARPHKPCLLLAVIDLFEAEKLQKNQIAFDATPRLLETFNIYFEAVAYPSDHKRACLPFVHLASDRFWHLESISGNEQELKGKISKDNITNQWIRQNVKCVRLDESFFNVCLDAHARHALREAIVEKFFPTGQKRFDESFSNPRPLSITNWRCETMTPQQKHAYHLTKPLEVPVFDESY